MQAFGAIFRRSTHWVHRQYLKVLLNARTASETLNLHLPRRPTLLPWNYLWLWKVKWIVEVVPRVGQLPVSQRRCPHQCCMIQLCILPPTLSSQNKEDHERLILTPLTTHQQRNAESARASLLHGRRHRYHRLRSQARQRSLPRISADQSRELEMESLCLFPLCQSHLNGA